MYLKDYMHGLDIIGFIYIYVYISMCFVCMFILILTVYTHLSAQTAGDPGITEDPLAYFSAIITFL